jgi:metal-dependent amidase/aminoacylase/carboxypeptidase family protein
MTQEITDDLIELLKSVDEPMVEIRHDLHAHPELAFNENYTTRLINDRLVALGWELAPCPTATGAVAVLRGAKPGRRVMVRADIDALPVTEEVELSYASRSEGVMHASVWGTAPTPIPVRRVGR